MQPVYHSRNQLFAQLGLPDDDDSIEAFIRRHAPLDEHTPLAEAPFWTDAQAAFLREAIAEDADWAEVVDHLDAELRHSD